MLTRDFRLERLMTRHVIKWQEIEESTYCRLEGFVCRVWQENDEWLFQVTKRGNNHLSGKDESQRKAQIQCERFLRQQ